PAAVPPPEPQASPAENPAFQASANARDRYWASIGEVEPDVISHLISPGLMGEPAWPTLRQAYRVVRRGSSVILATDGMSDPFDDAEEGNGFEMELMLETAHIPDELADPPGGGIDRLKESWAFDVLVTMASTVAGVGGIVDRLDDFGGFISTEAPGASGSPRIAGQVPSRFILDDSLGFLLGAPTPDFPVSVPGMPLSPVRIVPIVLLTAEELAYIRKGGAAERAEVARRLAASPTGHRCDLERASVI
ncbi:MAG: suppressor of fused domain protein, partial [Opitutaceae bacterium]|nr:suppressor of fused domain protein [Opitutaceae bacterium]